MAELRIWYFFEGTNDHDSVVISRNSYVSQLREEIFNRGASLFAAGMSILSLVLLKVDIDPEQYNYVLHDLQVPEDAPTLIPATKIQRWWPDELTDGHFRVCVRLPKPARKRPRIAEDYGKYVDKDLGTMVPSEVAKTSEVYRVQHDPSEHLANDRPETDTDHLPIALIYHGFGRFLDVLILKGTSTDHTLLIDRRTFEENVDKFVRSMNKYYPKEHERNTKAVEFLNDIFQCVLKNCWPLTAAAVSPGRYSDGHALGPTMGIEVILEVKNELAGTGADPIIEFSSYYTQALKRDLVRELLGTFSFPALGIVVIGSHVGFYALSYRERTRLVALTPLLPMTAESGNDWVRPTLLNAFEAACLLRHYMQKDAEEFMKSALKRDLSKFPYITKVATYSPSGGASTSTISFQIQEEAFQGRDTRYPNRFLYAATLDNPDDANKNGVIVKFTRRYFPQLHAFCASQGRAPQLLGYGTIPGGWLVVVMERIAQRDTNLHHYASKHLQTWSKDLRSLVSNFHNKGWVHGDLRDANMIVGNENPEQVMLVDFDWGGLDRQVHYATALVHEDLVKSAGDLGDLRITKEHDDCVLERTLDKLSKLTPKTIQA